MRSYAGAFSILCIALSATALRAQTEPTAETIRANYRTAIGPAPVNERVISTVVRPGSTGTKTYLRSGKDSRTDLQFGPLHTASGVDGGVTWRQNANGLTVTNVEDPAEPVYEAMTTSVLHVTEPKEMYVVARLSARGLGTKAYFDPQTWYEVRFERITATETVTTTYDDFRKTGGYVRAWHTVQSDGHAEDDVATTITSDDVDIVTAADLTVPNDTRMLVDFPAGKDHVQLPAELNPFLEKFIVRVKIGDRGLDFILDSGAAGIVLDRSVAQELGLPELETYSSAVNAGRYTGSRSVVPQMAIGDLVMRDVAIDTTPDLGIAGQGVKVVGLLGFDFLRSVSATLDYGAGTITVFKPQAFVQPANPKTIVLDVRLGHDVPQTSLTINGALGSRFTLDTGGYGAVMITDNFRRLHPEAVVDEKNAPRSIALRGIGGGFPVEEVTLKTIKLGTVEYGDVGAFVIKSSAYGRDSDGIIGPLVFYTYTLDLDLPHGKVYLVPQP